MENSKFNATVSSLFQGMDSVLSSKTVVGEAIHIGDTIILPLIDVSFGLAAGATSSNDSDKGAGGMGGKMSPTAALVIQNKKIRLINIKNQDTVTKILDFVPNVMDWLEQHKDKKMTEQDVSDLLDVAE